MMMNCSRAVNQLFKESWSVGETLNSQATLMVIITAWLRVPIVDLQYRCFREALVVIKTCHKDQLSTRTVQFSPAVAVIIRLREAALNRISQPLS